MLRPTKQAAGACSTISGASLPSGQLREITTSQAGLFGAKTLLWSGRIEALAFKVTQPRTPDFSQLLPQWIGRPPHSHLYVEGNGPRGRPTNGTTLVTGCPPRQAGPDSRLPAAAHAEPLSPKRSASTRAFSWDFQFIELVWLQPGWPDSTYNLLKFLVIFLRSGKKPGRERHQERKKTHSKTE